MTRKERRECYICHTVTEGFKVRKIRIPHAGYRMNGVVRTGDPVEPVQMYFSEVFVTLCSKHSHLGMPEAG